METIFINGRFLSRRVTGVDRFAIESIKALLDLVSSKNIPLRPVILRPHGHLIPDPFNGEIEIKEVGRLSGAMWEQIELPWFSRGSLLLNLCNTAPISKVPQIVAIHDAAPARVPESYGFKFRLFYKLLMPWLGRTARSVITVSQFSKSELTACYGIPPEKITILQESGEHFRSIIKDESILETHGLRSRPFVLAVSSLSPHKNFGVLVEAISLLPEELGFDVVIAGGSNPRIFSATQIPSFVKTVGFVSDQQLRALYEEAACFVFPSYYEGFGLPAAEAMALGCPVIAANAASIPEVCGEAAIYFPPHSAQDLARELMALLSSDTELHRRRALSFTQASTQSWSASGKQLLRDITKYTSGLSNANSRTMD